MFVFRNFLEHSIPIIENRVGHFDWRFYRMNICVIIFGSLLMFCIMLGCGEASEQIMQSEIHPEMSENSGRAIGSDDFPAAPAASPTSWHALSQSERNQKILDRAYKDLGKNLGIPDGRCKTWVQAVVQSASGGQVYPPKNDKLKDRWINDPKNTDSEYCIGRCAPITSARPGEIVQVRWKKHVNPPDNLHTFIVVSVNASTITVIDSNRKNNTTVRDEPINIDKFKANADSFSIYYIL